MKTVALAVEHFSRFAGGAESYAVALSAYLLEQGWEVHLFGERWDGEPSGAIFHPIRVPRYLPAWLKLLVFDRRHRRLLRRHPMDAVLGFGNTTTMSVYQSHGGVHRYSTERKLHSEPRPWRRLVKRAMIMMSIKQWVRHWIESAPFRQQPRPVLIAISEMIRQDMHRAFGVDTEDIHLVYNGVDTDRFHPDLRRRHRGALRRQQGVQDSDIIFLFVSYDLKKKGMLPLIEAAGRLRSDGHTRFQLWVIGGMPDAAMNRKVSRMGLDRTVRFMGKSKTVDVYYANADVFVLPTYYDACSLVAIEAMAAGLPVITTETNGAAGLITDGVSGHILSHPPTSAEIADRMRAMMDVQVCRQMSAAAAERGQTCSAARNHQTVARILDVSLSRRMPDPHD